MRVDLRVWPNQTTKTGWNRFPATVDRQAVMLSFKLHIDALLKANKTVPRV